MFGQDLGMQDLDHIGQLHIGFDDPRFPIIVGFMLVQAGIVVVNPLFLERLEGGIAFVGG